MTQIHRVLWAASGPSRCLVPGEPSGKEKSSVQLAAEKDRVGQGSRGHRLSLLHLRRTLLPESGRGWAGSLALIAPSSSSSAPYFTEESGAACSRTPANKPDIYAVCARKAQGPSPGHTSQRTFEFRPHGLTADRCPPRSWVRRV